jgi:HPt (histidine-containing phosphotransfer) domain-containing protein
MDDHLSKPINLQESGDKLERWGETETELPRGCGCNEEDLLQRVGGDHFLLKEVIGIFLVESPELLSRLDRAIKNQDPDGLATTAHSLKGELGYLDAGGATDITRRLEENGASARSDRSGTTACTLASRVVELGTAAAASCGDDT